VLVRGLAANPEARWPDMHALLREIDAAIAPPRKSRAPLIIAVSAAAVCFLGGGVALYLNKQAEPPAKKPSMLEIPLPDVPFVPSLPDHVTVPIPPRPPRPPRAPDPSHVRGPHAPRNARAASDCASASEAFGAAWSTERRAAVTERHKSDRALIAVAPLLDSLRRDWIKSYEATCAMPDSDTRRDRLACLIDARDEVNEATEELTTENSELSLAALVPLNITVGACQHQ
jgi:hypothetical protein